MTVVTKVARLRHTGDEWREEHDFDTFVTHIINVAQFGEKFLSPGFFMLQIENMTRQIVHQKYAPFTIAHKLRVPMVKIISPDHSVYKAWLS